MYYYYSRQTIEEGWNRRQGKGRRVGKGGKICSIPCRASCFAWVYLEEAVNSAVYLELTVSFKSYETRQLARQRIERILPPKPTRRPLPLLLSPSFFYEASNHFM